jgi:SAM-dependent methyltransferase
VWAVDYAEAMIAAAQAKGGRVHFQVADAGALPFEDRQFDLVCQVNVPLYAAETARVLAPGGHVILASSRGERTPYYTPDRLAHRQLARHGLEALPGGRTGSGTYALARRPAS